MISTSHLQNFLHSIEEASFTSNLFVLWLEKFLRNVAYLRAQITNVLDAIIEGLLYFLILSHLLDFLDCWVLHQLGQWWYLLDHMLIDLLAQFLQLSVSPPNRCFVVLLDLSLSFLQLALFHLEEALEG